MCKAKICNLENKTTFLYTLFQSLQHSAWMRTSFCLMHNPNDKKYEGSNALYQTMKFFLSYFDMSMCPLPKRNLITKERIKRYKSEEHSWNLFLETYISITTKIEDSDFQKFHVQPRGTLP